jgi:hypothetical protein
MAPVFLSCLFGFDFQKKSLCPHPMVVLLQGGAEVGPAWSSIHPEWTWDIKWAQSLFSYL